MTDGDWPAPEPHHEQRQRLPLPRVDDLPVAEQGYDREAVREAFDAFYRHAAQLDATLRTLEAVEVFQRTASELRAEMRTIRAGGWTVSSYGRGYGTSRAGGGFREWSLPPAFPRVAAEAVFLIVVGVIVGVAGWSRIEIVLVMGLALAIVWLVELAASRERATPPVAVAPARAPRLDAEPAEERADAGAAAARRPADAEEGPEALTILGAAADAERAREPVPSPEVRRTPPPVVVPGGPPPMHEPAPNALAADAAAAPEEAGPAADAEAAALDAGDEVDEAPEAELERAEELVAQSHEVAPASEAAPEDRDEVPAPEFVAESHEVAPAAEAAPEHRVEVPAPEFVAQSHEVAPAAEAAPEHRVEVPAPEFVAQSHEVAPAAEAAPEDGDEAPAPELVAQSHELAPAEPEDEAGGVVSAAEPEAAASPDEDTLSGVEVIEADAERRRFRLFRRSGAEEAAPSQPAADAHAPLAEPEDVQAAPVDPWEVGPEPAPLAAEPAPDAALDEPAPPRERRWFGRRRAPEPHDIEAAAHSRREPEPQDARAEAVGEQAPAAFDRPRMRRRPARRGRRR